VASEASLVVSAALSFGVPLIGVLFGSRLGLRSVLFGVGLSYDPLDGRSSVFAEACHLVVVLVNLVVDCLQIVLELSALSL